MFWKHSDVKMMLARFFGLPVIIVIIIMFIIFYTTVQTWRFKISFVCVGGGKGWSARNPSKKQRDITVDSTNPRKSTQSISHHLN